MTQYPHVPRKREPLYPHRPRSQAIAQTSIEGGESIPPEYQNLVDYINEPLPEFSLMVIEVEEGERKIDAVLRELKGGVETIQQSDNFSTNTASAIRYS